VLGRKSQNFVLAPCNTVNYDLIGTTLINGVEMIEGYSALLRNIESWEIMMDRYCTVALKLGTTVIMLTISKFD
jgi:hypothetical protein